jgi:hypothetical protein
MACDYFSHRCVVLLAFLLLLLLLSLASYPASKLTKPEHSARSHRTPSRLLPKLTAKLQGAKASLPRPPSAPKPLRPRSAHHKHRTEPSSWYPSRVLRSSKHASAGAPATATGSSGNANSTSTGSSTGPAWKRAITVMGKALSLSRAPELVSTAVRGSSAHEHRAHASRVVLRPDPAVSADSAASSSSVSRPTSPSASSCSSSVEVPREGLTENPLHSSARARELHLLAAQERVSSSAPMALPKANSVSALSRTKHPLLHSLSTPNLSRESALSAGATYSFPFLSTPPPQTPARKHRPLSLSVDLGSTSPSTQHAAHSTAHSPEHITPHIQHSEPSRYTAAVKHSSVDFSIAPPQPDAPPHASTSPPQPAALSACPVSDAATKAHDSAEETPITFDMELELLRCSRLSSSSSPVEPPVANEESSCGADDGALARSWLSPPPAFGWDKIKRFLVGEVGIFSLLFAVCSLERSSVPLFLFFSNSPNCVFFVCVGVLFFLFFFSVYMICLCVSVFHFLCELLANSS